MDNDLKGQKYLKVKREKLTVWNKQIDIPISLIGWPVIVGEQVSKRQIGTKISQVLMEKVKVVLLWSFFYFLSIFGFSAW